MIVFENLEDTDSIGRFLFQADGNNLHKQEELILRIQSCSETISQIKKLLEQNSIRLDVQEHLYTLQTTLDNLDAESLDENDVKNIESAINRALKAVAQFFPEGTLIPIETRETH